MSADSGFFFLAVPISSAINIVFLGNNLSDNPRKWLSRWRPLRRRHQPCSPRALATCSQSSTALTLPCHWAPNLTTTIITITTQRTPHRFPSPTYSAQSRSTANSSCVVRRHLITGPARQAAPAVAHQVALEPCPAAEVTTTALARSRPPRVGTYTRSFRLHRHRHPNIASPIWSPRTGTRPRGTAHRPTTRDSQVSWSNV